MRDVDYGTWDIVARYLVSCFAEPCLRMACLSLQTKEEYNGDRVPETVFSVCGVWRCFASVVDSIPEGKVFACNQKSDDFTLKFLRPSKITFIRNLFCTNL